MMPVLKRALPFILTLLVGVAVGSSLKRAERAATPQGAEVSCKMRKRQAMMRAPLPLPPPPMHYESDGFTAREVTRKAMITDKPEPLYTYNARRNNVTGTVRLRMLLAADGTVRNIAPLATLPDGLTEQAVEAARKIKFTPALKDDRTVSQYVTVEYNFDIY
ncbi:MAG TPA: energy transducer TonB [Pyrinomonadaceae bacterium]|nr:energy transducer TonB [Pyrinomonadaceae bacterium]